MRVLDVEQARSPLTAEIKDSAAFELLVSLCVFDAPPEERETFEVGRGWFQSVERSVSPDLLAAVRDFAVPHSRMWVHLFGIAYETPSPGDVPSFLAYLEALDPLEIRLHMLGYHYHASSRGDLAAETILQAARGEQDALKRLQEAWYAGDSCGQEALLRMISYDPAESKRWLLDILRRWYDEVFRADEPRVMPIIRRDAEARRQMAKSIAAERLVELATNGIQYVAPPGIRRVVLIPSYLYRPWSLMSEYRDARLFCHPVSDESFTVDRDAPPMHLVRLFEALADERRLRVIRRLASESMSLHEMAEFLGIAKSTMHHHLAILRGAGLLQAEAGSKRYGLRRDALSDLSSLLDVYLDEPST